jgi:hypothetical protein
MARPDAVRIVLGQWRIQTESKHAHPARRRKTSQEEDERVQITAEFQDEWKRILVYRHEGDAKVEVLTRER